MILSSLPPSRYALKESLFFGGSTVRLHVAVTDLPKLSEFDVDRDIPEITMDIHHPTTGQLIETMILGPWQGVWPDDQFEVAGWSKQGFRDAILEAIS